ncbi:MAG: hypothetical protein HC933_10540 [Pleurocapsa sp. SU_196_0]|nr:hypothetical protein [Pleurocapsa sp. SU_196_0]
MWIVFLFAVGLLCVILGLLVVAQAGWMRLFGDIPEHVLQRLLTGLKLVLTGSLCHLPGVIDAWTNPNEKNFGQVVIGYAAFVLPVSLALFVTSVWLRQQGRILSATTAALASFVTWVTVGWAQTLQLGALVIVALVWQ